MSANRSAASAWVALALCARDSASFSPASISAATWAAAAAAANAFAINRIPDAFARDASTWSCSSAVRNDALESTREAAPARVDNCASVAVRVSLALSRRRGSSCVKPPSMSSEEHSEGTQHPKYVAVDAVGVVCTATSTENCTRAYRAASCMSCVPGSMRALWLAMRMH
eukprot:scaffold215119_cov32-Tisochrysis_lutea.AAC.1